MKGTPMIPVVCSWDEGQVCDNAAWIIAWVCDRCEQEAIIDLCDAHYRDAFINMNGTPQKTNCPRCQGDVSWVARDMNNLTEDSLVNGWVNGRSPV